MKLTKSLGFIPVLSITIGSMISSGIFILPAQAFSLSGPSIIVSYIVGGICALIGSLSMIELTTAMPKAGGVYFFTSRSLGALVGTLSGLLMWIAIAMKGAFAIYGLASVVSLYTGLNFFIIGVVITLFYTALNIKGTKEAAKFDVCLVSSIILIMIPFVLFGYNKINWSDFTPFISNNGGFNSIIASAAFVFISFGGIMNAANVSEEMSNPKRDIPRAIIFAIVFVSILYTIILLIAIGTVPNSEFIKSINPIADAGKYILGMPGFVVITIAACLAFSSCANSGIMSSSRYPLAMSRDKLIPGFIGRLNKRSKTPIYAILLTAVLVIFSLSLPLNTLVHGASTVILTSYILTDISVLVLRTSKIQNYKPTFLVPLFPWINILSIFLFISLICHMGIEAIQISLGLIAISFIVYLIFARKNKQKYALYHIVEKIKNKNLSSDELENELSEIVQDRDNIIIDEFDRLIEKAPVIDLDRSYKLNKLLKIIAEKFHEKLSTIDAEKLFSLFIKREQEGSTVLIPTVAIPHVVIEQEGIFEIVLLRCKNGIEFSEKEKSVKAVIAIVGSKNNRTRHLKTFSAIAHIIQEKEFDDKWKKAETPKNLRDIFLLAERRRDT